MIDRPMRQVSLRKFRGEIAELREPVEVSRRDGDGIIQVLGFWTPYRRPVIATHPSTVSAAALDAGADSEEIRPAPLDLSVDDEFPMAEDSEFDRHPRTAPILITSPEEVATIVRPDPVRAVPKPSQRKRR